MNENNSKLVDRNRNKAIPKKHKPVENVSLFISRLMIISNVSLVTEVNDQVEDIRH